ncbi:MAG: STAS domain-containing protein [Rhodospirillales bacterium]|nr:STAS domain-containing protein [Rhodospirillales bacterium]
MSKNGGRRIPEVLARNESALLTDWLASQKAAAAYRPDLIKEGELREQSREFLRLLTQATRIGDSDVTGPSWQPVRDLLASISRSRGQQGFTPAATAMFVFSFKEPLFEHLRRELANDPKALVDETWAANVLLDQLGLYTTEVHQQSREEVIERQQREVLELSTPVVKLWDGILALPLIGTLDSARTQTVMENLLQRIVETGCETAIIDITGVPTVDTVTAQHLLKTVAAARLMGADCIISGIRPQIAQTIVHLGVDLSAVTTKASLADAFGLALRRLNLTITKTKTATDK